MPKRVLFSVLAIAAVMAAVLSWTLPAYAADGLRVRKNIDKLTTEELGDYIYAVQKLQEKSKTDDTIPNSYAYFAGLHDDPRRFDKACDHGNDRFIPWHRAMLWYYEEALRAVDPKRTSNVTIPYWDWSDKPSGNRYPWAFEDISLLAHPVKGPDKHTQGLPALTWKKIQEATLMKPYEEFAGTHTPNTKAAFESQLHDYMHGDYVGGALSSTATAANDPIFWSFHAFLDLLWWYRQQQIPDDQVSCMDCELRGMEKVREASPTKAGPTKVMDVISAETLGYIYDFKPPPAGLVNAHETFAEELPALAAESVAPAQNVKTFPVTLSAGAGSSLKVTLENVREADRESYTAFVYLYPKSVAFCA
jgi:tyrosinase